MQSGVSNDHEINEVVIKERGIFREIAQCNKVIALTKLCIMCSINHLFLYFHKDRYRYAIDHYPESGIAV